MNQRSFWATGEAKGGRDSSTDGKCISKEAQEFAAQEIISGKVQWGIVWNLKYSQFKRKEGLCSRGVRAGEASGAGWGGARAGRGSGGQDQAGVELRVRTLTHPACVELQRPRPWAGASVFGEPHPPPPPLAYWGTRSRLATQVGLRSKRRAHPTETDTTAVGRFLLSDAKRERTLPGRPDAARSSQRQTSPFEDTFSDHKLRHELRGLGGRLAELEGREYRRRWRSGDRQ